MTRDKSREPNVYRMCRRGKVLTTSMRVLVTGGTGFIGRALVPVLQREGHKVVAFARSPERARSRLGADVEIVGASGGPDTLEAAVEGSNAVINLAGEPILGGRWTPARKKALWDSRSTFTQRLVDAVRASRERPQVLISGSAVGYYGDRGDEPLTERSTAGADFLAKLCQTWEAAALKAEIPGTRVVRLRTGVVLGRDGGALGQMLPPFQLGLGGPVGPGTQFMPWVHLHDLVAIIAAAVTDKRFDGAINGVGPEPVRSADFARTLGRMLKRPAVLPLPAFALRALFGEAAVVLLASQRVEAARLRELGFTFAFPALEPALADVVGGVPIAVGRVSSPIDAHDSDFGRRYLSRRRPRYELRSTTVVKAPVGETFSFFSKAENLGLLTPARMQFALTAPAPPIGENTTIRYAMRVGIVPITWTSRIFGWSPGVRFVDVQEQGPYRAWWHEHAFRSDGSSTVMEDRVCYTPPLGLLGRLANRLFIVPALRRIFRYRADVIRLRFGGLS